MPIDSRPARVSAIEVTFALVVALIGFKLWFLDIVVFFNIGRGVSSFKA